MSKERERGPQPAAECPLPVKRADPTPVSDNWLNDAAYKAEAESIDRLQHDAELVTSLELRSFEGPWWEYFSNELAKYGIAVWRAWLATGVVYQRCKEKGYGLAPLSRPFTEEEIEDLTSSTVAIALARFRTDVLMQHRWDPRRGASLRTYFIGQCVIRFPNVYRAFRDNLARTAAEETVSAVDEFSQRESSRHTSTEDRVVTRLEAQEALARIKDPRVRYAVQAIAQGDRQSDIAQRLNVSVKTVERMVANERKRQTSRR